MGGNILDISIRARIEGFSLDVTERIPLTGIIGLFGPSGAGKSSLLRLIAGFMTPQQGHIALGDETFVNITQKINIPAHQRPIGYMFQDARLFPHLTIRQNLEYAYKRRTPRGEGISVDAVIEAFALDGLLERMPQDLAGKTGGAGGGISRRLSGKKPGGRPEGRLRGKSGGRSGAGSGRRSGGLSGGEMQRAALARTILTQPKLLLLDEPLSALDKGLKIQIFTYLERIAVQFGIPAFYVSHDIHEISRLARTVIKIDHGKITAMGALPDVLNAHLLPASEYTSTADGFTALLTVLDVTVVEHQRDHFLTRLETASFDIDVPLDENLVPGSTLRIFIHARDVIIATERPQHISIRNCLKGTVTHIDATAASPFATVSADLGGQALTALITKAATGALSLTPGQEVFFLVKSVTVDHL